jgi:hypothetical protein
VQIAWPRLPSFLQALAPAAATNGSPSRSSQSERRLVDLDVETSNQLFEILADWNTTLERAGHAERLREIVSQASPCP